MFVFQRKKGNEESRIKSDIFCQNGEQSREGSQFCYREKMRVVDKYINGHTSAAKNKVIGRLH